MRAHGTYLTAASAPRAPTLGGRRRKSWRPKRSSGRAQIDRLPRRPVDRRSTTALRRSPTPPGKVCPMSTQRHLPPAGPRERADPQLTRPARPSAPRLQRRLQADAARADRDPARDRRQGRHGQVTPKPAVMPHDKEHVLADVHQAPPSTSQQAIDAAAKRGRTGRAGRGRSARPFCSAPPSCSRARGATTLNAATMLGQSKTAHQAEIDAACELDRLLPLQRRVHDAHLRRAARSRRRASGTGWSTARSRASSSPSRRSTSPRSAANLPSSPALMGNIVVWKPAVDRDALGATT